MRIVIVGALAALLGSGCATVTRGTSQTWTVETDPVGADVKLSTGETCKSPCTLKRKRKVPFNVSIAKDGYAPVETQVLSSVSSAGAVGMAGNVLVGGFIGLGIDAGTGAAKDLKPNPLVVKMTPATIEATADAPVSNAIPVAPTGSEPTTTSDVGAAD